MALPLIIALFAGGVLVNWFANRTELSPERQPLTALSKTLGDWRQKGDPIKFDASIESVLKTTDYTMREYNLPDGRIANLYVGYYASQRTGATYHSPQNCLPGAGWVLSDPQIVVVTMADGRTLIFSSNRPHGKDRYDPMDYDMYQSKLNDLGEWSIPESLSFVNTDKSDQAPCISAQGDLMYYNFDNKDIYQVTIPYKFRQFVNNVGSF